MELHDLINREAEDGELLSFIRGLRGEAETFDLREGLSEDGYVWVLRDTGLQVSFDKNQKVNTMHVFSGAVEGYSGYPGALPMGVTFETNRDGAISLLGPPTRTGGPVSSVTDASIFYWDRWDWEGFSLHLKYPEDRGSISTLTIIRPDRLPS